MKAKHRKTFLFLLSEKPNLYMTFVVSHLAKYFNSSCYAEAQCGSPVFCFPCSPVPCLTGRNCKLAAL